MLSGGSEQVLGDVGLRCILVVRDEMNNRRWTANPESIEAGRQLFDLVAPFNLVGSQVPLGLGGVVGKNFKPDFRLGKMFTAVEPEVVVAELEDVVGKMIFKQ